MVVTFRNIVDGDHAAVIPMPCPALLTSTKLADVLVRLVHAVAADLTMVTTLDENTATANLITPAIAS